MAGAPGNARTSAGTGPSWSAAALAVARAQGVRALRDRTALFFIVVVPIVLIVLIGAAIPDEGEPSLRVGVAIDGALDAAAALVLEELEAQPAIHVEHVEHAAALGELLRRGVLSAGLEVPGDLGARLTDGDGTGADGRVPQELVFRPGAGTGGVAARAAVADAVSDAGARLGAAALASEFTGAELDDALDAAETFAQRPLATEVETRGEPTPLVPGGYAHTAPGNLVLFVFLNTVIAGATITDARRTGVARRMWATPASPSAVLAGEGLAKLIVALVQAGLIVAVSATLFGVDWGDPLGVAAVVALFALAAAGAAMLVGSLARTPQQVGALGPGLGIVLAALGGAMWPLDVVGGWLRSLALATPHGWAMNAFGDLVSRGAPIGEIAGAIGGLAAFAAALLVAGLAAGRVALRRE